MKRLMIALLLFISAPALAVTPDEMLADPALELRARTLGRELRCVVCQNQSIDDSNAALAHDLRALLRERLAAGDSDVAAIDYIAARYGDFVLLKPPVKAITALLWTGPALFLFAALALFLRLSQHASSTSTPLTDAEQKRLLALLERE
jgi:cytochrome c-type biogenesis protein CcmH